MRNILLTLLAIGEFGLSGPASAQIATQYPFLYPGRRQSRLEWLLLQHLPGMSGDRVRHRGRMPL